MPSPLAGRQHPSGCAHCAAVRRTKHGHKRGSGSTPTYQTWQAMWRRCTNPTNNRFKHYGARGITICDRWKSFEMFLADMGERPQGRTIDRKNHNGNYEPANCRWATAIEQRRNQRPRPSARFLVQRDITPRGYSEPFIRHRSFIVYDAKSPVLRKHHQLVYQQGDQYGTVGDRCAYLSHEDLLALERDGSVLRVLR